MLTKDQFCVFLDAGHGGIDPFGNYTTNGKKYKHVTGKFHEGTTFYEGVSNRIITEKVKRKLQEKGYFVVVVNHPYLDTTLTNRVKRANQMSKAFLHSIYISNHSNAGGGSGFEIYTSPGITRSDKLAQFYWDNMKKEFGDEILFRPNTTSIYQAKEAKFYVLINTSMPAILTEHMFFDNIDDATLLMNQSFIDRIVKVQVESVENYFINVS
jgi:N-acetylmuramoyl-L-alanine amidase